MKEGVYMLFKKMKALKNNKQVHSMLEYNAENGEDVILDLRTVDHGVTIELPKTTYKYIEQIILSVLNESGPDEVVISTDSNKNCIYVKNIAIKNTIVKTDASTPIGKVVKPIRYVISRNKIVCSNVGITLANKERDLELIKI